MLCHCVSLKENTSCDVKEYWFIWNGQLFLTSEIHCKTFFEDLNKAKNNGVFYKKIQFQTFQFRVSCPFFYNYLRNLLSISEWKLFPSHFFSFLQVFFFCVTCNSTKISKHHIDPNILSLVVGCFMLRYKNTYNNNNNNISFYLWAPFKTLKDTLQ